MIGYDLARLQCLRRQLRVLVLLTVIILLALSPMIGAEAVNNILGYREQENAVRGAALATAELRNSELERVVNGIVTLLGNASRIPKLGAQTGPSCDGLDQLLVNSPMRIVLAVADRAGRVVCSSVPIEHAVQIGDRDFFKSTIKENTFVTGGYVRSRLNDKAALVFGYPVRDHDTDEVIGTVLAYLDLDWLAVTLENARLLPGQKLTVTDQNGVVLAYLPSDQGDRVGTTIPSKYLQMLKAPAPGVMDMDDPEGRSAIYAFIPITVSPPNLYVLFSIRKEVAFATIHSAVWRSLALALLSILLGIGSAWLVAAKYFKAPIERLVLAAKQWGKGDYSRNAPTIGSGCIELKHLAEEFNRMATGINVRDNQLKASNRVKELTLATAGHDLRQPIQVLSSVLSLFSRKQLSDRERQYVDAAQSSIVKLVDGLDALVDAVHFHREALEGRYESFCIEPVLQDLAGQWSSKATEKGLHLRIRHCNAIIKSNRKMLLTILQNLVGNAIKYTKTGGILVACRRRRDYLWIEVYDTGVGIPENKLEIIFRDFQQLDPAREGYGLGLWITRNTAEALGHELHVRSVAGKGSCFQVIVPLAHVASVTDSSADGLDTVRTETPELAPDSIPALGAASLVGRVERVIE